MRRRHRHHGEAAINMTPMIDMVFLLLIFFVVTTSFARESGITVHRPHSARAYPQSPDYLALGLDARGQLHVAGQTVAVGDVAALRQQLERSGKRRVLVVADRAVPAGILVAVLDQCSAAGASQVDLAAERR